MNRSSWGTEDIDHIVPGVSRPLSLAEGVWFSNPLQPLNSTKIFDFTFCLHHKLNVAEIPWNYILERRLKVLVSANAETASPSSL